MAPHLAISMTLGEYLENTEAVHKSVIIHTSDRQVTDFRDACIPDLACNSDHLLIRPETEFLSR